MSKEQDKNPSSNDAVVKPRTINANDLRWLGEEADGKRDSDPNAEYVIVWREGRDGRGARLGISKAGHLSRGERIADGPIKVRTPFEGGGLRAEDHTICIKDNKTGKIVEVKGADCVFITQSSFGKFVIPYYTRFLSPNQIANMKRKYFLDDYIGVAHFPPSEDLGVQALAADEESEPLEAIRRSQQ